MRPGEHTQIDLTDAEWLVDVPPIPHPAGCGPDSLKQAAAPPSRGVPDPVVHPAAPDCHDPVRTVNRPAIAALRGNPGWSVANAQSRAVNRLSHRIFASWPVIPADGAGSGPCGRAAPAGNRIADHATTGSSRNSPKSWPHPTRDGYFGQWVIQCRILHAAADLPTVDGLVHLDDATSAVLMRETARLRSARSRGNGSVDVVRARPIST